MVVVVVGGSVDVVVAAVEATSTEVDGEQAVARSARTTAVMRIR